MGQQNTGPLADLRVIEMGTLLAGPFCGQLLGDQGADVIKVEAPSVGDPMRNWGREKPHGKSLWWPVVARNKKAITVKPEYWAGYDDLGLFYYIKGRNDEALAQFSRSLTLAPDNSRVYNHLGAVQMQL